MAGGRQNFRSSVVVMEVKENRRPQRLTVIIFKSRDHTGTEYNVVAPMKVHLLRVRTITISLLTTIHGCSFVH